MGAGPDQRREAGQVSLVNYTSYDSIRAALGVSSDEIRDEVLSLPIYDDHLSSDLEDINVGVDAMHTTVASLGSPSEDQIRFLRYARLFATYSVAKALTNTLPMFGPKSVEDGKAKVDRFNDPYKATIKAVLGDFERWRSKLLAAYLALGESATSSTPRTYMSVVSPSSDPVTGT